MLDARSRNCGAFLGRARDGAGLVSRLRLFAMLAVLVPIFGGLQYLVREQAPRVVVREVGPSQATTTSVVQAPTERIVERIVYVPVAAAEPAPSKQVVAQADRASEGQEPAAARPRQSRSELLAARSAEHAAGSVEYAARPAEEALTARPRRRCLTLERILWPRRRLASAAFAFSAVSAPP